MTDKPFTEEDVQLVAAATEQHHIVDGETDAMGNSPCVCGRWWDSADMEGWDEHMAEVALAALAETGRLLPHDSDVTHNWIVGFKTPNGDPHWEEFPTESNARWFASARRDWGCTEISIKKRIEALGPWEVLTDSKDNTDE